jgi:hypothetical protein
MQLFIFLSRDLYQAARHGQCDELCSSMGVNLVADLAETITGTKSVIWLCGSQLLPLNMPSIRLLLLLSAAPRRIS